MKCKRFISKIMFITLSLIMSGGGSSVNAQQNNIVTGTQLEVFSMQDTEKELYEIINNIEENRIHIIEYGKVKENRISNQYLEGNIFSKDNIDEIKNIDKNFKDSNEKFKKENNITESITYKNRRVKDIKDIEFEINKDEIFVKWNAVIESDLIYPDSTMSENTSIVVEPGTMLLDTKSKKIKSYEPFDVLESIEEQAKSSTKSEDIPLAYEFLNEKTIDKETTNIEKGTNLFQRDKINSYAKKYANGNTNPKYHKFSANCTNFVSQCIKESGVGVDKKGDSKWYYNSRSDYSTSWAVAHDFVYYSRRNSDAGGLGMYYTSNVSNLTSGDVIALDFQKDGKIDHLMMVIYNYNGTPYIAQNTPDRYNIPWYTHISSTTKAYYLKANNYWYN